MSWLISLCIVIIVLSVMVGIVFLLDKFDITLGFWYFILLLLCIGLLIIATIAVHQILF